MNTNLWIMLAIYLICIPINFVILAKYGTDKDLFHSYREAILPSCLGFLMTGILICILLVLFLVDNAGKVSQKIGAFFGTLFDGTLGKIWTKFEKPSSTQE